MTSAEANTASQTLDRILREARRAWFRCGVRRRDRRRLSAELEAELDGAQSRAHLIDVLGPEPGRAAAEWARSQGVADRRLRLAAFMVPAVLAGVVAAGGVLAVLADAFTGDGQTLLGDPSPALVLSLYLGSAVLAAAAGVATTGLILSAVHDAATALTVKVVACALPIGGVVATVVGIVIAQTEGFTTRPRTFAYASAGVAVTLLFTVATARLIAVHRHPHRQATTPPL